MLARLLLLACASVAAGLNLDVRIHYPDSHSAYDPCGFTLRVATPFGDQETPPAAEHTGKDFFVAHLDIPDKHLYTQVNIAVVADFDANKVGSPECLSYCPRLGPQGMLVQNGAYHHSSPLMPHNEVDLWPSFCKLSPSWTTKNATFRSDAIGTGVVVTARLPAAFAENPLPRPVDKMPPVMFRFNPEWYWPNPAEEYTTWHDLMINGMLEPLVVAEIYIDGVSWQEWDNQPIFTKQALTKACTCKPELQFICDSWKRGGGYDGYVGGNHQFGTADGFMDELYDLALPQVLEKLPRFTGSKEGLRIGSWGYCIGGLAAWNALTSRSGKFNVAYLGSPAMDFDCGAPFDSVPSLSWNGVGQRPKVYIDAGSAEGDLMNRQTLLLMRQLQERGAVEGQDIFYRRWEYGTHQGRSLLARGLHGLLVLFGTGSGSQTAYKPVLEQATVSNLMAQQTGWPLSATATVLLLVSFLGFALAAFVAGRSAGIRTAESVVVQKPLLA